AAGGDQLVSGEDGAGFPAPPGAGEQPRRDVTAVAVRRGRRVDVVKKAVEQGGQGGRARTPGAPVHTNPRLLGGDVQLPVLGPDPNQVLAEDDLGQRGDRRQELGHGSVRDCLGTLGDGEGGGRG